MPPDPFDLFNGYYQPTYDLRATVDHDWDEVGNPDGVGVAVDANRLTSYDGWTLRYDAAGFPASRSKTGVRSDTLFWNALGQLDSVRVVGGGTVGFRYDGFGRRVARIAPGGAIRRYVYDGDHVLMETNGAGVRERMYSYYPGVDQPHSVREFGGSLAGRYYYLMELPGHVSGMVDEDGVLVNEYRYSAFGRAEFTRDSVPNTLRFMARERDADAGLYYVRNRWYDPEAGRFVSEDPIGIAGGINLYVYAMNDPMGRLDPYGLDPCTLLVEYSYYKKSGEIIPESVRIIGWTGNCGGSTPGAPSPGNRYRPVTECRAMASVAQAIGNRARRADNFIRAFAYAVASVSSWGDLRRGSNQIRGATPDGFRSELGGDDPYNPRHFAGNAWAANQGSRGLANTLSALRESGSGGSIQDHRLSNAAYDMVEALNSGALSPSAVGPYIMTHVCGGSES